MLEVFKFLRIDAFDLIVINFTILDQWEQNISGESLYLHIEPLCDLALLETFVDPSDMLPEGRVIIILNAIIGSIRITRIKKFGYISPLISINFVGIEYDFLLLMVDGGLLDVGVKMVMPSFSALLSGTSSNLMDIRELLCDKCPSFSSILSH